MGAQAHDKPLTDKTVINSLYDSLRALNTVLVNTPDLDSDAKLEALYVKKMLDLGKLSLSEVCEYLKAESIDIQAHDLYKRSKMMQERGR